MLAAGTPLDLDVWSGILSGTDMTGGFVSPGGGPLGMLWSFHGVVLGRCMYCEGILRIDGSLVWLTKLGVRKWLG